MIRILFRPRQRRFGKLTNEAADTAVLAVCSGKPVGYAAITARLRSRGYHVGEASVAVAVERLKCVGSLEDIESTGTDGKLHLGYVLSGSNAPRLELPPNDQTPVFAPLVL